MNCYYCKGVNTIEELAVRLCACEGTHPYIVENVPTFVCRLCGEKSYLGETLTELEKITKGEVVAISVQVVQVFDFDTLEGSANQLTGSGLSSATDIEFQNVPLVVLYEKSDQWWHTDIRQIGWHTSDDKRHAEFSYMLAAEAFHAFQVPGFSKVLDFKPYAASRTMKVSDFKNPHLSTQRMRVTISKGE